MNEPLAYASASIELPPRDIGRPFLMTVGIFLSSWIAGIALSIFLEVLGQRHFGGVGSFVLGVATLAACLATVVLLPVYCCVTGCRYPLTRLAWFIVWSWAGIAVFGFLGSCIGLVGNGDAYDRGSHFIVGMSLGIAAGYFIGLIVCCVGIVIGWKSLLRRAELAGQDGVLVR